MDKNVVLEKMKGVKSMAKTNKDRIKKGAMMTFGGFILLELAMAKGYIKGMREGYTSKPFDYDDDGSHDPDDEDYVE